MGGSCTVVVVFVPFETGPSSAKVVVTADAGVGSPTILARFGVRGRGIAPGNQCAELVAGPPSVVAKALRTAGEAP